MVLSWFSRRISRSRSFASVIALRALFRTAAYCACRAFASRLWKPSRSALRLPFGAPCFPTYTGNRHRPSASRIPDIVLFAVFLTATYHIRSFVFQNLQIFLSPLVRTASGIPLGVFGTYREQTFVASAQTSGYPPQDDPDCLSNVHKRCRARRLSCCSLRCSPVRHCAGSGQRCVSYL